MPTKYKIGDTVEVKLDRRKDGIIGRINSIYFNASTEQYYYDIACYDYEIDQISCIEEIITPLKELGSITELIKKKHAN